MRWIFLVLLSLNLAYIAWQMNMPATVSYEDVPPLKNISPIILLAELGDEGKKTEPGQILSENTPESQSDTEEYSENKSTEKAATAEAKVEPAVKDGKLLAKVEQVKTEPVEPAVKKAVADNGAADKREGCFSIGPFHELDQLRVLTREIKPYVKTTDFRGSEVKADSLYWVYLKAEKNYEKAVATGKRLKSKKIKDFYIISEGDKQNGLSLGRFRNKAGAYGLAKKVTKLGFEVMVEPVDKVKTVYWLDYQLDGAAIPENIFSRYAASSKKNKITRLDRDCKA